MSVILATYVIYTLSAGLAAVFAMLIFKIFGKFVDLPLEHLCSRQTYDIYRDSIECACVASFWLKLAGTIRINLSTTTRLEN